VGVFGRLLGCVGERWCAVPCPPVWSHLRRHPVRPRPGLCPRQARPSHTGLAGLRAGLLTLCWM